MLFPSLPGHGDGAERATQPDRATGPDTGVGPWADGPGELRVDLTGSGGRDRGKLATRSALTLHGLGRFYAWRRADIVAQDAVRRLGFESSLVTAGPVALGSLVRLAGVPFGSLGRDAAIVTEPPGRLDRSRVPSGRRGVFFHPLDHRLSLGVYWDEGPGRVGISSPSDVAQAMALPPTPPQSEARFVAHTEVPLGERVSLAHLAAATMLPPTEPAERWFPKEPAASPEGLLGLTALQAQLRARRLFGLIAVAGSAGLQVSPGAVIGAAAGVDLPVDGVLLTRLSAFGRGTVQLGRFLTLSGTRSREYLLTEAQAEVELAGTLALEAEYDLELFPPELPPGVGAPPGSSGADTLYLRPFSWEEAAEVDLVYSREPSPRHPGHSVTAGYSINREYTAPAGALEESVDAGLSGAVEGARLDGELSAVVEMGRSGWTGVEIAAVLGARVRTLEISLAPEVVVPPSDLGPPEWGGSLRGRYAGTHVEADVELDLPLRPAGEASLTEIRVTVSVAVEQKLRSR